MGFAMASTPPLPKDLSVKIARNDPDRVRLYRFRYGVLVEELGASPSGADHETMLVHDPQDEGATHLFLVAGRELIATLRINFGTDTPMPQPLYEAFQLDKFEDFPATDLSFTSALVVAARWRGSPVLSVLLGAAYKMCRERHVRFDFCHCTPTLLALYQRLGYRRYGNNFVEEAGLQVPLVLLTEDLRHLKDVRSPLFQLAAKYENSTDALLWFGRHFPDFERATETVNMSEDDFWVYLTRRLHTAPHESVPLLRDLTKDEAKRLAAAGSVLTCKAGETLIRRGDMGNEMFVLLSGAVEVRIGPKGKQVIDTLDRGAIFGEMAFLSEVRRTASVVALSDVEVLVITQKYLRDIMESMPKIACRVLFNLSLVLCERLANSTANLSAGAKSASPAAETTRKQQVA